VLEHIQERDGIEAPMAAQQTGQGSTFHGLQAEALRRELNGRSSRLDTPRVEAL
jgi:hypothetical protein